MDFIKSPLNYIGGKFRLLPQIHPLFPKKMNVFVDLFTGGCNVGINVSAKKIYCNDNLTYLIDLYKAFQEYSTEEILAYIKQQIQKFDLSLTNKDGYLRLRESYNSNRNPLDLFVLTAYSFNHQIRFNNQHEFNNPFGFERSCFNEVMERNLLFFLAKLHSSDITFTNQDFTEFNISNLAENDFVYCDPPYLITDGTYNDGKRGFTGWSETQEEKLLQLLDDLDRQGVSFALSNVLRHKGKQNDLLLNWLTIRNYSVFPLRMTYSNSNYQTKDRNRKASDEVLITNYEPTGLNLKIFETEEIFA